MSEEFYLASLEQIMVVDMVGRHCPLFVEVVHVKLSYKRIHIAMFEINGKNFLAEFLGVTYDYEVPTITPTDDVGMRSLFEELVSLSNERCDTIRRNWGLNVEFFFESK
jgi:hypothetical protein